MTNEPTGQVADDLPAEDQQRLAEILDGYLEAMEQGRPISPDKLLDQHPEDAAYLRNYLSGLRLFHDAAAADPLSPAAAEGLVPTQAGQMIGEFRLIREVGRGGMGVVYEAEQQSLKRRVALKVLPYVSESNEKRLQRFHAESQIAASIEHPHIVPVFAIGEEQGVHFYAMQFVDGESLGDWIGGRRHDADTIDARNAGDTLAGQTNVRDETVDLHGAEVPADGAENETSITAFRGGELAQHIASVGEFGVQAADALHAAHEYGVVHRDVKPSNLLIDQSDKLWITDFGLARWRDGSDLTQTGDVLGTFMYMSPEQAGEHGGLVDHRTDVYSLGVTLYEAAVLRHPRGGGPASMDKLMGPLKRLRQWDRRVPVDFETIVMKAVAETPAERYQTMGELADDLRRFLADEPILAKPPGALRRLQKWAKRRQGAVISGVCALFVAVAALSVALVLVQGEKKKTDRLLVHANEQLRETREILDSSSQIAEQLAAVPGAERVRYQLLETTLNYYRALADEAAGNPELQSDVALAFGKMGDQTAKIGDKQEALTHHRRGKAILEALLAEDSKNPSLERRLAVSWNNIGDLEKDLGQTDAAWQSVREADAIQQRLLEQWPDDAELKGEAAATTSNLGLLAMERGDEDAARVAFSRAVQLLAETTTGEGDQSELRQLAIAYGNSAAVYEGTSVDEARRFYGDAIEIQKKLVESQELNLIYQRDLARSYNNLGRLAARQGDWQEAEASYAAAIAIQDQLRKKAPAVAGYQRDLAVSQNNLGMVLATRGELQEALKLFEESAALQRKLLLRNPEDLQALMSLGGLLNNFGSLMTQVNDDTSAREAFREAVERQSAALEIAPNSQRVRELLSNHLYNQAECSYRLGSVDEAIEAARRRRDLWPEHSPRRASAAAELVKYRTNQGSVAGMGVN